MPGCIHTVAVVSCIACIHGGGAGRSVANGRLARLTSTRTCTQLTAPPACLCGCLANGLGDHLQPHPSLWQQGAERVLVCERLHEFIDHTHEEYWISASPTDPRLTTKVCRVLAHPVATEFARTVFQKTGVWQNSEDTTAFW